VDVLTEQRQDKNGRILGSKFQDLSKNIEDSGLRLFTKYGAVCLNKYAHRSLPFTMNPKGSHH